MEIIIIILLIIVIVLQLIPRKNNNEKLKEEILNVIKTNEELQNTQIKDLNQATTNLQNSIRSDLNNQNNTLINSIDNQNKRIDNIVQSLMNFQNGLSNSLNEQQKNNTNVINNQNEKIDKLNQGNLELQNNLLNQIRDLQNSLNNSIIDIQKTNTNNSNLQGEKLEKLNNSNILMQENIVNEIRVQLDKIRESNEKKLSEIESTVNTKLDETLGSRLDSSFKQVGEQLNNLYTTLADLKSLSSGVTDLNKTLSNVKTRGTWGEMQLDAILEQTMTHQQYERNVKIKKNSNDLVEFAIKIPQRINECGFAYLPIDSKMPTDIYAKIIDASDNADKDALRLAVKEMENRIKTEAKSIRDKYIDPPVTVDFAIMFLPTESLYAEVLRIDGLSEFCQEHYRIMIAGPSTILALLNSLRIGFANMAINEKSKEVLKVLSAMKSQYGKLTEAIEDTQKSLEQAQKKTENMKRRTEMIQKKMKDIQELDLKEANNLLGITDDLIDNE